MYYSPVTWAFQQTIMLEKVINAPLQLPLCNISSNDTAFTKLYEDTADLIDPELALIFSSENIVFNQPAITVRYAASTFPLVVINKFKKFGQAFLPLADNSINCCTQLIKLNSN